MRSPLPPDQVDQTIRMQEQIRQLRLRTARNQWPWTSLRRYLCGGWIDLMSSHPYRYDVPAEDEEIIDTCGFFDTGRILIFTGTIYWGPDDWWESAPYDAGAVANPLLQGDPPVYTDATHLIGPFDGLGNNIAGVQDPDDLGYLLPYKLMKDNNSPLRLPTGDSWNYGVANEWTNGANLDVNPENSNVGPGPDASTYGHAWANLAMSTVGRGVVDPEGFTHHGGIRGNAYRLDGLVVHYDADATIAAVEGFPARTQDDA